MSFAARVGSYYKGGFGVYFSNAAVVSISEQDLTRRLVADMVLSGASAVTILEQDPAWRLTADVVLSAAAVDVSPKDVSLPVTLSEASLNLLQGDMSLPVALSGASLNLSQGDVSLPVALTPAEVNITPQDLNQSFLYTAQMSAESITLTTNDLFWSGEFNAHLETVDLSIPSYPLDFTQNWSFVSYGTEESWQQIDYGESV